jgi:hypothetical protein
LWAPLRAEQVPSSQVPQYRLNHHNIRGMRGSHLSFWAWAQIQLESFLQSPASRIRLSLDGSIACYQCLRLFVDQ